MNWGIIGAMDEEVAELKKEMNIEVTRQIAHVMFYKGTLTEEISYYANQVSER
ncbi:hypothetical protein [Thalassobacillus sp. C254]|uniref:hypothetical protein n=1 Tax=Thalassobacillus sp. C254 TaxID=1225341 RepID=UPI00277D0BAD|nr:hypothetical protein [Thalassobacillus sp. C254]